MRIRDLKQILWWLGGGLLLCTGVLVAVMFFLKPSQSYALKYSLFAAQQLKNASQVDQASRTASWDLKNYEATYELKIDGIAPPEPVKPREKPIEKTSPKDYKLTDFIDVVALWTNVTFYRLKNRTSKVEEVVIGDTIPRDQIPELDGKARLDRIEFEKSPFRAVFVLNGKEEIFLVPQEAVILDRPESEQVAVAKEEYRGPNGGVRPMVRKIPATSGVKTDKDGTVKLGSDVQELINTDYEQFFKDVAWDETDKGIAISKIRKGSRLDLLNQQANGILKDGDVVVSVNGVKVKSKAQIINHFKKNQVPPGQKVRVEIFRSQLGKTLFQNFQVPGK